MWPTSIAVSKSSAPPQFGQVSPSADSRRSAKRGWKSRPASTPRRCQPSRFAPATNWPSRSVSSATTSPLKPTGPSEPPEAPNAARISSSVAGRDGRPSAASSFAGSMRSSPAHEREHDGAVVGRHGHRLRGRSDVDREELRQRLAGLHVRASRPPRWRRASPGRSARAGRRARPRCRRRSRRSRR